MTALFRTAGEIRFGAGASREAAKTATRFAPRLFLVTGARSIEATGFLDSLKAVEHERWKVSGEPEAAIVDEGAARCRDARAGVVLAVGGGSVLDAAKAVAALVPNGGGIVDYLEGVGSGRPITKPPLPFVAVPTTAGSGSEVTRNAVIRVAAKGVKRSIRHDLLLPRVAIVDPDLSGRAPRDVAASAGLDALTHLIEAYASKGAQATTDALARPGIRLAVGALRALASGETTDGSREAMALASLWGGMTLANAGLGAVHGLVAPLGGRCAIPHGVGCAAMLPETLAANLRALRERAPESAALKRYQEVAELLAPGGDLETALSGLKDLRRRLGVKSLGDLGMAESEIAGIVRDSRGSSMKYNPVELTDGELEGILRACL